MSGVAEGCVGCVSGGREVTAQSDVDEKHERVAEIGSGWCVGGPMARTTVPSGHYRDVRLRGRQVGCFRAIAKEGFAFVM